MSKLSKKEIPGEFISTKDLLGLQSELVRIVETPMRPYTIFVDLDGTLVQHNYQPETKLDVFLPGALDRLEAWHKSGHLIVITTARNPREAEVPMAQIRHRLVDRVGVVYGCTTGVRVLINDRSPEGQDKAHAINVNRDEGIDGVVLE